MLAEDLGANLERYKQISAKWRYQGRDADADAMDELVREVERQIAAKEVQQ